MNSPTPSNVEVDGKLSNQSEDSSHGMVGILDSSRERVKQQGLDVSQLGYSRNLKPGIEEFQVAHGRWVEEQNVQTAELRKALKSQTGEIELRILVDSCMSHYFNLFHMKTTAAQADVFYVMSGMWKTQAERFFLWVGGFRPSEIQETLIRHLETLSEQQLVEAGNLKQSCHQAEDALSQGMEKIQQILSPTIAAGQLGDGNYLPQIDAAMEKLEALVRVLNQADHLRQETLVQMARILTTRQTAQAFLALGEYFERLRALSSWCLRYGIEEFQVEHGRWVEEQNVQTAELRKALKSQIGEIELRILVDSCMSHYFNLFHMKRTAAKADAFYVMSGMWKTQAECFFLWIGGFRPSEILETLPQLETLSEQQLVEAGNLTQSCHAAEDALSQGLEKIQQIISSTISAGQLGEGNYLPQIDAAMEKLEALVRFLNQADHLRRETLEQMARILTTRQAARAFLALGEYFERLRALSSLWSSNPAEP